MRRSKPSSKPPAARRYFASRSLRSPLSVSSSRPRSSSCARGDVLVVTKLDRLARSVPHLCEIGQRLDAKGVGLKVLDQAIDTTTPTGRLMFNMLGAIAQFERELIRERMLVGIAKAKAEGKYKGRAPTARAKAEKVRQLKAAGVGPSEIARQVGNQPHVRVSDTNRRVEREPYTSHTEAPFPWAARAKSQRRARCSVRDLVLTALLAVRPIRSCLGRTVIERV